MSKVLMGLEYPRFAPIVSEAENSLPTYDGDSAITIGELITANLTVTTRSGELYSDNALNISISEWASASLAANLDGIDDDKAAVLFGCSVENGLVTYKSSDVAPFGGLAYYREMRDKSGHVYFQGVFFPKVQAVLGNDNAQTKSNTITFQTRDVTFSVMEADDNTWQMQETFDTEAEAIEWVNGRFGDVADTTLASLTIGSAVLSPEFDKNVMRYTAVTSAATGAITVACTDTDNADAVIVFGDSTIASGSSATWEAGDNVVTIVVNNGGSSRTYVVTVKKSA